MLAAGLIVSRFIHFTAVLALFGGALFPLYAVRGVRTDAPPRFGAGPPWMLIASSLAALVSGVSWFAFTAASMSGTLAAAADPSVLATVLEATDFGVLWLGRLGLIGALVVLILLNRRGKQGSWTTAFFAGLALASLAGTGHARTTEGWNGLLHILADAAHLLAAGVWLGGLWPLGFAVTHPRQGGTLDGREIAAMLTRFSGIGYVAVAALVASGLVNSWYLVGSIGNLTSAPYGRLLLAKLALFAGMAVLAAANRFWITPRLAKGAPDSAETWLPRLRRHIAGEQAVGLLVIAIVSVLGSLQPAIES